MESKAISRTAVTRWGQDGWACHQSQFPYHQLGAHVCLPRKLSGGNHWGNSSCRFKQTNKQTDRGCFLFWEGRNFFFNPNCPQITPTSHRCCPERSNWTNKVNVLPGPVISFFLLTFCRWKQKPLPPSRPPSHPWRSPLVHPLQLVPHKDTHTHPSSGSPASESQAHPWGFRQQRWSSPHHSALIALPKSPLMLFLDPRNGLSAALLTSFVPSGFTHLHFGFQVFLSEASFMVPSLPPAFFPRTFFSLKMFRFTEKLKGQYSECPHTLPRIIQLTIHQLLPFCHMCSLPICILLNHLEVHPSWLQPKHFQQNHSTLSASQKLNINCIVL